jgi:hypothetical protein
MKRYALALLGSALLSLPCWGQYVITTLNYANATPIIGHFVDSAGVFHGYLLKGGIFSQIDFPGALDTLPFYMNVGGDIAGEWDSDPTQLGHAFVQMNSGEWVSFDAPGAPANSTLAIGINDHGEVLGFCRDSSGQEHTFLVNASNLAPETLPCRLCHRTQALKRSTTPRRS